MDVELGELEREFRNSWRCYDPNRYSQFLARTRTQNRIELLARLLSAELEYSYQPPDPFTEHGSTDVSADEERVRPSMQLFVLRFPELCDHQETLIRLSVLEYALRLRHDRIPPNPDSYLALCEQAPDRLINLLRLTEKRLPVGRFYDSPDSVCSSDSTVKDAQVSPSIALGPLPHNLGCFLLLKMIGKGGMGYVHSAIDLRSTAQVAVKVMRRTDPWSVHRFIEEFTWLSQLSHPNLLKLYDAFSEGDVRYFSMELIEGKNIREWFQRIDKHESSRWSRLRRVLAQTALAIDFLHQHGVIHCDIKCSNVMIASRRRAVLLDLGLAVREGNSQPMVGTLQYMSPEVLEGAKPSRKSDWYSFGMLLFEVMADTYPPIKVDVSAPVGAQKYSMDRQKLTNVLATSDSELADLCGQLLNADPGERPTGASVLERLGVSSYDPDTAIRKVVGRKLVIDQLNRACQDSLTTPRIALVYGEPGIGKSAVVEHWLQNHHCCSNEIQLRVHCHRQDHTPLRLLNALVQELVHVLQCVAGSNWRSTLSLHVREIADAFPQILQLLADGQAITSHLKPPSSNSTLRSKSLQRLTQWLLELSRSLRMLIVLDDAQWADEESLQLIIGLACSHEFSGFLVIIDENGPVRIDHLVRDVQQVSEIGQDNHHRLATIEVTPLSQEASIGFLSDLAGEQAMDLVPGIAKSIAARAEGSPFLLLELFRAYCHYSKREGVSDEEWLQADSDNAVRRRFSLLPIQSENVLQYLAVAGQSIGLHQLQIVSRILPHELQRTLSLLAYQGWVRSESNNLDADVEIAHENFRRVVLESLPADRYQRRHFRMARMLSSEVPPPWARMADHYWEAEKFREAATCYLEAARTAFRSSAYKDALSFLQRAQYNDADRSGQEREDILRLQADCLAGIGNSLAAAQIYDSLGHLSEDAPDRQRYTCLAGEQWIRGGQNERGVERLGAALQELGITGLRCSVISKLVFRYHAVWYTLTNKPGMNGQHAPHQGVSTLDESLNRVSLPLTFLDSQLGPDLILRMKRRSGDHGSEFDQAVATLNWALLLSFGGKRCKALAVRWLRDGRSMARQSERPAARGSAQLAMFVWHSQNGEFNRAAHHATKAIEWFGRDPSSLQWECQFLQWGLVGCSWYTGRLLHCRETVSLLRKSAEDRGDSMSAFLMRVGAPHWSDLICGNVQQARDSLTHASQWLVDQTFQPPQFFFWISQVLQHVYEGQLSEANEALHKNWRHLAHSCVFGTNHFQWLALRTRLCCDLAQLRETRSSRYRRDAKHCLKRMSRMPEPVFQAYAKAFSLVLRAASSNDAPTQPQWQSVVDELHSRKHHLLANSLTWHQSRYAPAQDRDRLRSSAEAFFHEAGCPQPEHLMDIILPLLDA